MEMIDGFISKNLLKKSLMSVQAIPQPLNEAQIELLKLFAGGLTPAQFQELRQLLITFRFKLLDQQVETVVAQKNISDEAIEKASFEHRRTPYRRKLTAKSVSRPDDLKKIGGISAEMEQILHQAGILTYIQLAQTAVETLFIVFQQAGQRFEKQQLNHWLAQAVLAAAGKWTELTQLQKPL